MNGYVGDIDTLTTTNNNFRQVLFTAKSCQLVVMSLLPLEEIGDEIHDVDQFFRIEKGIGKVIIDGVESIIKDGTAIIVPARCKHNVINTSDTEQLKLYTLYCPPHHKDQVIHTTKAAAEADTTDHL